MKTVLISLCAVATILQSCKTGKIVPLEDQQVQLFDVQLIFDKERFPNVVTATDGTLIVVWGSQNVRIRRSEDGGATWGAEIPIGSGINGGGAIVDEMTGDILVFTEDTHPPSPLHMYRSKDHGLTWKEELITIHPDSNGNIPSMSMNEHGITVMRGPNAGRLIRASRDYGGGNDTEYWNLHYTNAIYSDDRGKTWYTSAPFPVYGTGEAAICEIGDGILYYNSRRHRSTDGQSPRWRYSALSHDGGQTWDKASISDVLPDGNQHSDYGLMAGLMSMPVDGHDVMIFSNIDVPKKEKEEDYAFEVRWKERIRGTVWASFDGGITWPVKRLVDPGSFAYSSLAVGRKGTPSEGFIYLCYESDGGAKMARFNLAWVTEGRDWKTYIVHHK